MYTDVTYCGNQSGHKLLARMNFSIWIFNYGNLRFFFSFFNIWFWKPRRVTSAYQWQETTGVRARFCRDFWGRRGAATAIVGPLADNGSDSMEAIGPNLAPLLAFVRIIENIIAHRAQKLRVHVLRRGTRESKSFPTFCNARLGRRNLPPVKVSRLFSSWIDPHLYVCRSSECLKIFAIAPLYIYYTK